MQWLTLKPLLLPSLNLYYSGIMYCYHHLPITYLLSGFDYLIQDPLVQVSSLLPNLHLLYPPKPKRVPP